MQTKIGKKYSAQILTLVACLTGVWLHAGADQHGAPEGSTEMAHVITADRVTSNVRIRATPMLDGQIIGGLNIGERASLVSENTHWYKIETPDGVTGYVHRDWTRKVGGATLSKPAPAQVAAAPVAPTESEPKTVNDRAKPAAASVLPETDSTPDTSAAPVNTSENVTMDAKPMMAVADTSAWVCKWCLFDTERTTSVEVGFGDVSSGSYKFGRFSGLGDKGAYLGSGVDSHYMGEQGGYWDVSGQNLGSDLIRFSASGGRQGEFGLLVKYDQLPVLSQDTAATPYLNLTDSTLILAPGWIAADTTDGMLALSPASAGLDIKHERRRAELNAYYIINRKWDVSLNLSHEEQLGETLTGGSIGGPLIAGFPFQTRSAILRQPLDQFTQSMNAAVSYSGTKTNVSAGFLASVFEEDSSVLIWNNAFLPTTGVTADNGLMSLDPDSRFYKAFVSGGHRFSGSTRLTGRLSYGRAIQNASFWPATINPNIPFVHLPRESLDGQVNTINGSLRLSSRPLPKLNLSMNLAYSDRDNETPQAVYTYVITDTAISNTPRTNLPYSFSKEAYDLSGTYRINRSTRLSLGHDFDRIERTFQDVTTNIENTFWARLALSPDPRFDIDVKLAQSDRRASAIGLVPEIQPMQSKFFRKYNMAPRKRDLMTGSLTLTPGANYSIGLSTQYLDDDYTDTTLGLSDSSERSYTVDLSLSPSERVSFTTFLTVDELKTTLVHSENQITPTWSATTKDTFNTVGATLRVGTSLDKLSFGLEYLQTDSDGETGFISADPTVTPLPDLDTMMRRIRAYADYNMSQKLLVRLSYLRADYDSLDWALDNVEVDTIPSILWTGERSFNYDVNIPSLSFRYQF